jgi:hypothetical protein
LLNNSFFFRVKSVREGERRSRRKLGIAPEFKAEDLPVRTRRPRVQVQSAPVETTAPELPRALEKTVVVAPVARPFFLLPTPAVNSADVDNEAMAIISQGVVVEAPCVVLEVVAAEQVLEATENVPVVPVPVAHAPQRGWARWCVSAALAVGNMIVNDGPVFF